MKKLILMVMVVLVAISLLGCGQKTDNSAVSAYADDITEKMLRAYNEDNYAQYIANTDSQFKSLVTEDKMKQGNKLIRDKIGTYIPGSKKFTDAVPTTQNNVSTWRSDIPPNLPMKPGTW
ncbi:MAG: hypothetical protein NTV45_02775 [Firmicutes bacterium]|nr:hypothetical protein [Bacillota bacterium]